MWHQVCILVFTQYDTCKLANWIWLRPQSYVVLFRHLLKGIHHEQKIEATHQHVFFMLMASCSLVKIYKDGVTLCMHPTSSHRTWQFTQRLIYYMENATDVLRQVIVKKFTMVYCIHDVHECPCQFYTISPKGNKLCLPIHIRPPLL
jgi:hypothetical protein